MQHESANATIERIEPVSVPPVQSALIKSWTNGVAFEDSAKQQVANIASLPFIFKHIAIMPDVHMGNGAAVGSVIPTKDVIIPSAVGVDLGCGMCAVKTSLKASQLPDNLFALRCEIESRIPHGREVARGHRNDPGAWQEIPDAVAKKWNERLGDRFTRLTDKHPWLQKTNHIGHLGTLGTGNHFVEICLDTEDSVWIMLHSGSRGVGNKIGSHFIEQAKKEMERWHIRLPDKELAYLPHGSKHFDEYVEAVHWAQTYASTNRELMMEATIAAMRHVLKIDFDVNLEAVNCHHNYISKERHFGDNVWVTRKGAVSAQLDEMGIIPGSMGARSFIVRGLGNRESFCSCSHGAGRVMSRTAAKKLVTMEQHLEDTKGVECRKDEDVLDETPRAYKDIDAVMAAQSDLVEIKHTLKQILCVKG